MDESQFERLLQAINRNTDAQIEHAKAVHRLADECVNLAATVADPEEVGDGSAAGLDMSGRPMVAR